jgi:flagellar motor protein MotB
VPFNQQVQKTRTYQQLDEQLTGQLAADQVEIQQLQNLVRVTLASGMLFAEGGVELTPAGKDMLARLAPALKVLSGQRIVIASFTDNVPLGGDLRMLFAGNVELSMARARAVSAYLVSEGVPAALISAVGLGETHPRASNDTAQGRARNRRVEIDVVQAPQ